MFKMNNLFNQNSSVGHFSFVNKMSMGGVAK